MQFLSAPPFHGHVAESADALGSGLSDFGRAGATPAVPTISGGVVKQQTRWLEGSVTKVVQVQVLPPPPLQFRNVLSTVYR